MTKPAPGPAERDLPDDEAITVRARAGIDQARKTAGKALAATRRKGEAIVDDTREKGFRAAAETNRLFYEHPVAAVAAAAAAGAIIGIFLPRVAVAGKASRIAGQAMKLAIASETAQAMWTGIKETRNVAVKNAAGKAVGAVGAHIGSRRRKARANASAAPQPQDTSAQDIPEAPDTDSAA